VSLRQPDTLDANPRAVPACGLGCSPSCSPASARAGPVPCRALVSIPLGAVGGRATEAGGFPGWCGRGKGECCCLLLPGGGSGTWPGWLGRCQPKHGWHLPSVGASWVGQSLSPLPAVQNVPAAALLWENPFPQWEGFRRGCALFCLLGKGVLHSVSEGLFRARMGVANAVAGAEHRLCPWRTHWALSAEPCWASSHSSWLLSGHRLTLTGSRSSWQ